MSDSISTTNHSKVIFVVLQVLKPKKWNSNQWNFICQSYCFEFFLLFWRFWQQKLSKRQVFVVRKSSVAHQFAQQTKAPCSATPNLNVLNFCLGAVTHWGLENRTEKLFSIVSFSVRFWYLSKYSICHWQFFPTWNQQLNLNFPFQ